MISKIYSNDMFIKTNESSKEIPIEKGTYKLIFCFKNEINKNDRILILSIKTDNINFNYNIPINEYLTIDIDNNSIYSLINVSFIDLEFNISIEKIN